MHQVGQILLPNLYTVAEGCCSHSFIVVTVNQLFSPFDSLQVLMYCTTTVQSKDDVLHAVTQVIFPDCTGTQSFMVSACPCRKSLHPMISGKCQFKYSYLQTCYQTTISSQMSRDAVRSCGTGRVCSFFLHFASPVERCFCRKKCGPFAPLSFAGCLCLSARVKTAELFERWRNLQVCKWEQNKEETNNFK